MLKLLSSSSPVQTLTRGNLAPRLQESITWLVVIAIVAGYVAWLVPSLEQFPWKFDEGIYVQEAVLQLQGQRLYSDIWSERPPLFSWMLALGMGVFGRTVLVGRALVLATGALALLALAGLGRSLAGGWRGRFAAVLSPMILMVLPHFYGIATKILIELSPVSFAITALALARAFSVAQTRWWRGVWLVLCALSFATSLLIKPVTAPMLVPLCMLLVVERGDQAPQGRGWVVALAKCSALAAIMVVPALAMMLYYGPSTFMRHIVGTVSTLRGEHALSLGKNWSMVYGYFTDDKWHLAYPWLIALAVLGWGTLVQRGRRWPALALFAWLGAVLAALMTHTPIRRHHLFLLQPPMVVAASLAIAHGAEGIAEFGRSPWRARIMTLLCLTGTCWFAASLPSVVKVTLGRRASTLSPSLETPLRENAITYIQESTPPHSMILCDDPMLAFVADRPIPPSLAAPSYKRIESGEMGLEFMTNLATNTAPGIIACWEGRFDRVPGFRDWIEPRYALGYAPKHDRHIYRSLPADIDRQIPLALSPRGLVLLGAEVGDLRLEPGGSLAVDLYLMAIRDMDEDLTLTLNLMDLDGRNRWAQTDIRPLDDTLMTSAWTPGQIIHQRTILVSAPDTPPGPKMLRMSFYDGSKQTLPLESADGREIAGGEVRLRQEPVVRWRAQNDGLQLEVYQQADLGSVARLVGSDMSHARVRPGETVTLTLGWRSLQPTEESYTVFVHLVDARGRLVAQSDGRPGQGSFPTYGWIPDEYIRDVHVLRLPVDLTTGEYRIHVGMYELGSGQRLLLPDGGSSVILDQGVSVY